MTRAVLPKLPYRSDIDGFRALAVSAVVMFHAFAFLLPTGYSCIDIFFVISGYLITNQLCWALEAGTFSMRQFYARRIRRIFPSLILVLTVLTIVEWVILPADRLKEYGKHLMASIAFVANILFWHEPAIYDGLGPQKSLLHFWSLGIEEQFYIFWPLIIFVSWKLTKTVLPIVVILLATSFYLNITMIHTDPLGTYYLATTRSWEVLAGAVLYFIARKDSVIAPRIADVVSIVGMSLVLYGFFFLGKGYPGWNALFPVVGSAMVIGAGPKAFVNRTFLSLPPVVWLGVISYPIYLWHWPVLAVIRQLKVDSTATILAGVAFSVFLAWLTYWYVEKPVRASTHPQTVPALSAAMVLLLVAATATYFLN